MRKPKIAVAGNLLVDHLKTLRSYPGEGLLADIEGVSRSTGGCAANTSLNLAGMRGDIGISALGMVGEDEDGRYVLERLTQGGVDVSGVRVTSRAKTSFSDAFSARDTGERTFFHYRGANALFAPEDIDLDRLECDILHIGYLLLLDRFDAPDPIYGTVMARFLCEARARGIRTSIDVVSGKQGRFRETVLPALKYCDYAIMNEIEGCAVSGLPARDGSGRLIVENIERTLKLFVERGVRGRAVIHCPEAGFCMDGEGGFSVSPSLRLPEGYAVSSVGAGDAFCAGCLYAISQGIPAEEMLSFAAAAAAASLHAADAVSGMKDVETLRHMARDWDKNAL